MINEAHCCAFIIFENTTFVENQLIGANGSVLFLKPQSSSSEEGSKKQFCAAVRDAHIALSDQRCRNAEQSFSEALRILGSTGTKVSYDTHRHVLSMAWQMKRTPEVIGLCIM